MIQDSESCAENYTELPILEKIKLNEEILQQLRQLSARDDVSIGALSKLVAKEPKLGAKIIKFASSQNSSASRTGGASRTGRTSRTGSTHSTEYNAPVATIAQAVMKLGADALCQVYEELLQKERRDLL